MMEIRAIRCLRPNVTREEAITTFTAPGPASLYWKLRSGSLQRIADAYIPFRIYRVRYPMGGARHTHLFALDAVDGSLDLVSVCRTQRCIRCTASTRSISPASWP